MQVALKDFHSLASAPAKLASDNAPNDAAMHARQRRRGRSTCGDESVWIPREPHGLLAIPTAEFTVPSALKLASHQAGSTVAVPEG